METNSLTNAFSKLSDAMSDMAKAFVDIATEIVSNAWKAMREVVGKINLDKRLSRKKFTKLLMSRGIQRNEANKIAWKIHQKYGKYTVKDLLSSIKISQEGKLENNL